MKEKTFVSAVVYVYNAEKVIQKYLEDLNKALFNKFDLYEIILVNDCSTDNTIKMIKEYGKKIEGTLTIVNLAWRHHREHAMLAGTELAIGDFVFEFESTRADFSWDIIDKLYEKSVSGFDIVYAYPKGNTKKKSKIFYWLLNKLTYLNIETATEKAKIISRKALNRVLLEKAKVRYRKVLYKHCGFPASFIEYEPIQKDFSENEITFFQKASLATDVFIVFSNIGTHIAMFFSFVSFILSASIGIYALTVYLTGQATISGWTTTMLFLSLGFSGIFLILTIMSKYISIMLSEQRKGQLYTIQNIDKISIH